MTFGQSYLTHLKCLENVGMTSIEPIDVRRQGDRPAPVFKSCSARPASSSGPRTKGKTNIGCIFRGKKDGKDKTYYLYNICDHEECYKEVGSQAVVLHHRCSCHDRRHDGNDRQMEQTRRVTTSKSSIRIRSWMHSTNGACPGKKTRDPVLVD